MSKPDTDQPVVWQSPNLPAKTALAAALIAWPTTGWLEWLASAIAFGAAFTWAWLELFHGDSLFRRVLGAIVMVGLLVVVVLHASMEK